MVATFRGHLLVLGFYLIATLFFSWPVVRVLPTHVAGQGGDPWQSMWRLEETAHQLQQARHDGRLLAHVQTEIGGGGRPRLVNLSAWPWLPVQYVFGQPVAYNLIWLSSYVLSGWATYGLVRIYSGQWGVRFGVGNAVVSLPALLAGLAFMFIPYRVAHSLGHFGAMQTQWLVLAIAALVAFARRPRVGSALAVVVATGLTAWTEHHYALWLAIFFLLYAARRWPTVSQAMRRAPWLTLAVLGGVGVVVVVPYLPTIRLAATDAAAIVTGTVQTERLSADLFSWVVPAPWHPLWGGAAAALFTRHFRGNEGEATQYLGLVIILLVIFFRQRSGRAELKFWLLVALVFGVIALGPRLHALGAGLIPLPWALVDGWPVFSAVRTVARAGVMVGISVIMVFAWTLLTQFKRRGALVFVGALVLADFLFAPVPVMSARLSGAYAQVATLPGTALIEIPAVTNYTAASRALYASRRHGKNVVGSIALERGENLQAQAVIRSLPVLRHILYVQTEALGPGRTDWLEQRPEETLPDVLSWLDVGGIIIHRDSVSPTQWEALHGVLTNQLGLQAEFYDDAAVYEVSSLASAPTDGVFVMRDHRWQVARTPAGSPLIQLGREGLMTVVNRGSQRTVTLGFEIAPGGDGTVTVYDKSEMIAGRLSGASGDTVTVALTVPPGAHPFRFVNNLPTPAQFTRGFIEASR